jgi:sulfatase modifying factor 1
MIKLIVIAALILPTSFVLAQGQNQMIKIDGGSFPVYDESGKLRNTITVNSFYMAKYTVTNAEWAPFRKEFAKQIRYQGFGRGAFYAEDVSPDSEMPTLGMTWYAAVVYCNWLSAKEKLQPVYNIQGDWARSEALKNPPIVTANWGANGYRLPTLAEWMFAYTERGLRKTKYPGSDNLAEVAFYSEKRPSRIKAAPVGTKKSSAQGIYDLLGNVSQWCWDYFAKDYLYTAEPNNPHGPIEVVFDKNIFDSPSGAGGNPDTPYYKTARVMVGIPFGGDLSSGLINEGAGVENFASGIRLVRNAP